MGRPFRRTRSGIKVQLEPAERVLLARLLSDVDELLADDAAQREGDSTGNGSAGNGSAGNGVTGRGRAGRDPARGAGDPDAELLASLEASLAVIPPADPAVARLLPPGHRDDDELADSYRRLTEHGLRARKRAELGRASAALTRPEPVLLDPGEALALLKGLTDVRLVLAERLGVRSDQDAEQLHVLLARAADLEDPRIAAAALYDALTWWQEALVTTLR